LTDDHGTTSTIPGVIRGTSPSFGDERGSFREVWRASALDPAPLAPLPGAAFVQANLSISSSGVLRGLHLHRRQLDLWFVAGGRAFTALVDVRPILEGAERPLVDTMVLDADDWVAIPAGVAHGFLALEPVRLLYLVTNEYDGSDELGFAWDDPLAAIPWPPVEASPDGRPILSERDRTNPPLAELVVRLRDGGS
jgi:dTDP-4-dehydrorhamnose 3,5-epimerase